MAARISLNFTFKILNLDVISVGVNNIVIGDTNKVDAWMPFGPWTSNPIMSGGLPPVGEFWTKPRKGMWFWQIDSPDKTHIMLRVGGDVVGAIAEFPRREFEKGNHRLKGFWVINYDKWEMGGEWTGVGESYDRT